MLIAILGFGSIWTSRVNSRGHRAAYFNTTGILASGKFRHRSCIYGYIRIDECTGFYPESAHRALDRVYESEPLIHWQGKRKLFLTRLLPNGTCPERYLVRVSSASIGWMDRHDSWMCEAGEVVSFSEGNDQQETLVLLPAFGWLQGSNGSFYLDPDAKHPWIAKLTVLQGELQ